jgi:hypothetical protein
MMGELSDDVDQHGRRIPFDDSPEAQLQGVELLPCPLAHPVVNGIAYRSSSGVRKWHLICYDCGLVFEGRLDETARDLFARWNTRADLPRATADAAALLREFRQWLIIPSSDGVEKTAWPEWIARIDAVLSTPRATGETTVESALAELRELFPSVGKDWQFISIRRQEFIDTYTVNVSRRVEIHIGDGQSPPSCEAETLDEAMAQVRATRTEGEGK